MVNLLQGKGEMDHVLKINWFSWFLELGVKWIFDLRGVLQSSCCFPFNELKKRFTLAR